MVNAISYEMDCFFLGRNLVKQDITNGGDNSEKYKFNIHLWKMCIISKWDRLKFDELKKKFMTAWHSTKMLIPLLAQLPGLQNGSTCHKVYREDFIAMFFIE